MVAKAGYEVLGEPRPEKKHFEVLAKKVGQYYEVHAHCDGTLKGIHTVAIVNDWAPQTRGLFVARSLPLKRRRRP
jgi:hypothetical protein